jgi:RND family efflux transporter MFP subunit
MTSLRLLVLSSAALLGAATAGAAVPPLAVETVRAQTSTAAVPVVATGQFERRAEAALAFKTGGVIRAVHVRPGDRVQRGQELASLRLDEIDAAVSQARAGADKARRDLVRVRALHAERVATLEQLQDSETAVAVAEAALRTAEFNRTHSVLLAPADGRILRRHAEPEELAAPGRPILDFAAENSGWIARVGVSERDSLRLAPGDGATLALRDGRTVAARITQIAEGLDPATRTVAVELEFTDAAPAGLRSGFTAQAVITPQPGAARSIVPLAAVVEGSKRTAHVFLLNPDRRSVRRVAVAIEALGDEAAYLRDPLPADAELVTTGAEFLTDGHPVNVTNATSTGGAR